MNKDLQSLLDELQQLNLRIHKQLEIAEAQVPLIDEVVQRLTCVHGLDDSVILGDVICNRPYSPNSGREDSSQVVQAALMTTVGIGVVYWDLEEFVEMQRFPYDGTSPAKAKFQAFAKCNAAERGLALPHLLPLFQRFQQLLGQH